MDHIASLVDEKFSWHTALTLAHCTGEVYKETADMKKTIIDEWGYKKLVFISQADTQLFVATVEDKVIICFRGSEHLNDWITNFKVNWSDIFAYGQVHSGFHSAYKVVEDTLKQCLVDIDMTGKRIWVTGHSLGAALACICLAELKSLYGDQIVGCYTFGQPRTGDNVFADFISTNYTNRLFRIVNANDIVPRVPPIYKHVGLLYHLNDDGTLTSTRGSSGPRLTLSTADEEATAESSSLPPLSDKEFADLQQALANPQAGTLGILDHLSLLKNHLVIPYVERIQAYINSPLFNLVFD